MTKLSEDGDVYERGIVLGSVGVLENPAVFTRFGIQGFPVLIFFHKGLIYSFKRKTKIFESLKKFVLSGFEAQGVGIIPKQQTSLEWTIKTAKLVGMELIDAAKRKQGPAGYAILVIIGILLF